jgi:hypothetical protein
MEVVSGIIGIVLDVLVVALFTVLFYVALARAVVGHPRFERRLEVVSVWVAAHVFPGFWRWFGPRVWGAVQRFERWWEHDPAEERGE